MTLAIAIPQFATTNEGNGQAAHEGVLPATGCHGATLRAVSEQQTANTI
jgi:hypothetical protein